ncbi:MAG: PKD domain-containing protein, partial [Bacteroidota bacterium]
GNYTVSLLVRDVNGCEDVISKVNYIRLSHPVAQFTFDQTEVCPGIPVGVTFTDQSIPDHPLTSWNWEFGDGGTSVLQNPTYSYTTPGNYSVILTVTNIYGCTDADTINGSITVLDPPVAAFSAVDTADCIPFNTGFLDLSTTGDTLIQVWLGF